MIPLVQKQEMASSLRMDTLHRACLLSSAFPVKRFLRAEPLQCIPLNVLKSGVSDNYLVL